MSKFISNCRARKLALAASIVTLNECITQRHPQSHLPANVMEWAGVFDRFTWAGVPVTELHLTMTHKLRWNLHQCRDWLDAYSVIKRSPASSSVWFIGWARLKCQKHFAKIKRNVRNRMRNGVEKVYLILSTDRLRLVNATCTGIGFFNRQRHGERSINALSWSESELSFCWIDSGYSTSPLLETL